MPWWVFGRGLRWKSEGEPAEEAAKSEPALLSEEATPDARGPIERGQAAGAILEDPLVRSAVKRFHDAALQRMMGAESYEEICDARGEVRAAEAFAMHLRGVYEAGKAKLAEDLRSKLEREEAAERARLRGLRTAS